MKKYPHLLIALTLSLLIPSLATAKSYKMFSVFGNDMLEQFQQQAPADTLFYTDGRSDWRTRAIDFSDSVSLSQLEMAMADLENLATEEVLPEAIFLATLLRDMMDAIAKGNSDFIAQYGLTKDMASAFYLDGLVPVLQVAIEQPEPILATFDKAGRESGLQKTRDIWGSHEVHYWTLATRAELGFDLWLTLALEETFASVALIPENLSQARRLDALGLMPEATSLADTKAMTKLRKQQAYMDYAAGFFSLLETARVMTESGAANKTSEDMMQLFGSTPASEFSPACRREFMALATGVPRMVFGYDTINQQSNAILMDGHALLEITDQQIAAQLTKLNGHLPAYATNADKTLFSAALGLDMAALAPVINYLRSRLLQADFGCPDLLELQMAATSVDPSVLAMVTAMGQGISGVGIAIHDIDINNLMAGLFTVDGLVSIAAKDPSLLAGLAGLMPELAGIVIPADGSSIPLNLPDLPPGLNPKVAVRGKHLVIFDGDIAASSTRSIALENLNHDGLFAMSTDYGKVGALARQSLPQIGALTESDASSCADLHSSLAVFNDVDMEFTLTETFTPAGLRVDFSSLLHTPKRQSRQFKPGEYSLQQLGDGCVWEFVGYETLATNGTGGYSITDDEGQCDLFVAEYSWQQSGATLTFVEQDTMGRNSCDEPMQAGEPDQYGCTIISVNDNGFDCLFDYGDGDQQVYRYIRER